ncbi:MAG: hypothetical protein WD555_04480 [Fulvivirga sp.]
MVEEFNVLNSDEVEMMYRVPVLVSILIAGADNDIDRSELKQAENLSRIKQTKAREDLIDFYREAGKDFEDKIKLMIQRYPSGAAERNAQIIAELEKINQILPKLDNRFAVVFYASIKDMAKKIAESSGGVLGYLAVGYEESKLIELDMIKDPRT